MLRTSLRTVAHIHGGLVKQFLSSNAQDFIEERDMFGYADEYAEFLSSNAQDFIEDDFRPPAWERAMIPEQ